MERRAQYKFNLRELDMNDGEDGLSNAPRGAYLDSVARTVEMWNRMAVKLGIRIVAPFQFEYGNGVHECLAFLPDFGSPRGTVLGAVPIHGIALDKVLIQYAEDNQMYVSFISLSKYSESDTAEFTDALSDWGYFGPEDTRPQWLTPKVV
jgi:hypothetical protein